MACLRAAHQVLDAPPLLLEDPAALALFGPDAADLAERDALSGGVRTTSLPTRAGTRMWIFYATFAMFCFAAMQLLFKQLTRMGLDSPVILAFVFAIGALLYLAHSTATGVSLAVSARALGFIALASVLSYAGNLYMVRAIGAAPNPGYAMAVVGVQAVVVTLAAILLFGSELSLVKALGVLLSVAGVALLALGA